MRELHPSVAIVGIGGIFPDAPDLAASGTISRRAEVLPARFRRVAGRFRPTRSSIRKRGRPTVSIHAAAVFLIALLSAAALPDLAIDAARLEGLDPLFHLLLHAGKRAFDDGVTTPLDRSRVGVIIGNLALPSETSSLLTRNWLGRTFEESCSARRRLPLRPSPLNRYPGRSTGRDAGLRPSASVGALHP